MHNASPENWWEPLPANRPACGRRHSKVVEGKEVQLETKQEEVELVWERSGQHDEAGSSIPVWRETE
jgi:hypothetical protein